MNSKDRNSQYNCLIVCCCLYSNTSVCVHPTMFYSYISKGNNFVSFRQWYIHVYGEALCSTVVKLRKFHATVTKNTSTFVHSIEKKSVIEFIETGLKSTPPDPLVLQWCYQLTDDINNLTNLTHIKWDNQFLKYSFRQQFAFFLALWSITIVNIVEKKPITHVILFFLLSSQSAYPHKVTMF